MKVLITKSPFKWYSYIDVAEKYSFGNKCLESILKWVLKYPIKLNNYLYSKFTGFRLVKIDNSDVWSFDYTLSLIILPGLKKLKETKHGSPLVDYSDVPEELHCKNCDGEHSDENCLLHDRWEYVLDEMIYAFEEKQNDTFIIDKERYSRMENGFRLFGKYYQSLWD